MKKTSLFLFSAIGFALISIVSCKKINEATEVGGELIPAVDNVTTFETFLPAEASKYFFPTDTTKFFFSDYAALGKLNDPVFGSTTANLYFNLSLPVYGVNPFNHRDSASIDSVVLSLSYIGAYGDTSAASTQTLRVFEIAPNSTFNHDTSYRFTTTDFATGLELGSKTYSPSALKDSIVLIRKDTGKVANVIRVRLNNTLGQRFLNYDTTSNPSSGGFRSDSLFRTLFRGLAIKAESFTGNGSLSYINLTDQAKTNLTIYYKVTRNGIKDTTSINLTHARNGQANIINRQPGGEFGSNLAQGSSPDGKLYIQSTPGSYVSLKIPALDTFKNKVIHRAELIVSKIPSQLENIFTPPSRLFLEKINNAGDSAFLFQNDLPLALDGSVDFASFGGSLRADNTYRFTLTRHVQGIITRKETNYAFRLYAPLRARVYLPAPGGGWAAYDLPVIDNPAKGRVVVGGANYTNPTQRMRMRIIYSNL